MSVRTLLYGDGPTADPYAGFDPSTVPDAKLETWWAESLPALEALVAEADPQLALEVGSWKGWSAAIFARYLSKKPNAELVCVDTWLGSAEMVRHKTPLHRRHGLPQVYWHFLANMKREGFASVVTPYAQTSQAAAQVFAELGVRFDLIYLDAAHDYASVLMDLMTWAQLLAPGGTLAGDDFDEKSDPEVVQAVLEFSKVAAWNDGTRLQLHLDGRTWRLR